MRGKQWIDSFMKSLNELEDQSNTKSDGEWTKFMAKVMKAMEKKTNWRVISRDSEERRDSGEYLNIDAMFLDKSAYPSNWNIGDWDPYILPSAVVEHENDYGFEKIAYCLWKIVCIRAEVRVLICYQNNKEKIDSLTKYLEKIVKKSKLMEKVQGELFVIIGNDEEKKSSWKKYFKIFEWRIGSLGSLSVP